MECCHLYLWGYPDLSAWPPFLLSPLGKTALLHALASSDGVQVHNTDNIRLLLEGGEARPAPASASPAAAPAPPPFGPAWWGLQASSHLLF